MKSPDFLEELTEQEESTVQGGRTRLTIAGVQFPITGIPVASPFGAYVSFPAAFFFPTGIASGIPGFRIDFEVSRQSDAPTHNILSGTVAAQSNGLAGLLGLPTGPNNLITGI